MEETIYSAFSIRFYAWNRVSVVQFVLKRVTVPCQVRIEIVDYDLNVYREIFRRNLPRVLPNRVNSFSKLSGRNTPMNIETRLPYTWNPFIDARNS